MMNDEILEERKKAFLEKNLDAVHEIEEYAAKLRKQKREFQIASKRNKAFSEEKSLGENSIQQLGPVLSNPAIPLEERIALATRELSDPSSDVGKIHELLVFLRKSLKGAVDKAGSGEFVDTWGLTYKLIELLHSEVEQICLDAAWVLTNMSVESREVVAKLRATKTQFYLLSLLSKGSDAVKEQSLWLLANILGDSAEARDELLSTELVERLLEFLSAKAAKLTLLQLVCWTISNLLKGRPSPCFERAKMLIERMDTLLFVEDDTVISDTLWGISHFTDGPKEAIKVVRKSIPLVRVVQFMRYENLLIKRPALRIIGNICVGDNDDVEDTIQAGCIPELVTILNTCEQKELLREACWALSNIAANSEVQVELLIASKAIKALVSLVRRKTDLGVRREGAWALANACVCGNPKQLGRLVDKKVLEALVDVLELVDPQAIYTFLKAIDYVLESGNANGVTNYIASQFELIGGRKALERLQVHGNPRIYKTAVDILEKHYRMEDVALHSELSSGSEANAMMPAENAHVGMPMEDAPEEMPI